jgi:hypothetical protein
MFIIYPQIIIVNCLYYKDTCCFDCTKFESGDDCEDEAMVRFSCGVGRKGDNDCLSCKDTDESCGMFVRK